MPRQSRIKSEMGIYHIMFEYDAKGEFGLGFRIGAGITKGITISWSK